VRFLFLLRKPRCHAAKLAGLRLEVNATRSSPMSKRKPTKAWVAYKFANIGKRLGTVYGETEKEALANAQKEFAKTEAEKKRIYLRAQ
jgi:hypothetical protein